MRVLLEIKICSYKGPNEFYSTQHEISNKNSHFFDIYEEIEKLGDDEFGRTDKANESIALFLDEMKRKVDTDYREQKIFENLPHILDLDGHVLRKTADIMMAYIQSIM
jgi:hypothetical protein